MTRTVPFAIGDGLVSTTRDLCLVILNHLRHWRWPLPKTTCRGDKNRALFQFQWLANKSLSISVAPLYERMTRWRHDPTSNDCSLITFVRAGDRGRELFLGLLDIIWLLSDSSLRHQTQSLIRGPLSEWDRRGPDVLHVYWSVQWGANLGVVLDIWPYCPSPFWGLRISHSTHYKRQWCSRRVCPTRTVVNRQCLISSVVFF